jgi:hypothetical protein
MHGGTHHQGKEAEENENCSGGGRAGHEKTPFEKIDAGGSKVVRGLFGY